MRGMETPFAPVEIFYSFAEADAALLEKLESHLSVLRREGYISTWHKRQVVAGSGWQAELDHHLNTASLVLLLISPHFLASDYQYGVELRQAMERHEAKEAYVLPILLRPCDWKNASFSRLQILPRNEKPITSWRNRDEAWVNVAHDIRKALEKLLSEEQKKALLTSNAQLSLEAQITPARPTRFPAVWNVPYRYTFFFTGRDHLVEHLFANFTSVHASGITPVQALSGLGGLGKTQTAVEYAYRYRQHYQAVLWVRAETEEDLFASFKYVAELLKRPAAHLQDAKTLSDSMQEWFRNTTDWLLIIDNADNLALVEPFLPKSARGHLLLTTRATSLGSFAQRVSLTPLTPDDGALCILRRANSVPWNSPLSTASKASVKAAQELSQLMDGLPLALEQAGAYIETTGRSASGYLDLYHRYRPEIQRSQHGVVPTYREPVAFAWNIAREAVKQENAAAIELLHLCAYLSPNAIPYELFTKGAHILGPTLGPVAAHAVALDRAMALLRQHSLIKNEVDHDTDISRLSIHHVLQEILQDDMNAQAQHLWAERTVRAVALALPCVQWQVMQAHVRSCIPLIERWNMNFHEADLLRQCITTEHV